MNILLNHLSKKYKRRSGFTLVELLVVITIIAILMGLAFPSLQAAMRFAKKSEAKVIVAQLGTAIASYKTEYNRLPIKTLGRPQQDEQFEAGELYFVLTGQEEKGSEMDNPRRITFLDFNTKYLRQGPANDLNRLPPDNPIDADTFVDPWNREYQIIMDFDYDKRIDVPDTSAAAMPQDSVTINSTVAIWSLGDDPELPRSYVASWK
ncbi:MAG: type II secretion system protein [Verrucomicrobiota bacterium]